MSSERPQAQQDLEACLRDLVPTIDAVDPGHADDAAARLASALPFDGPEVGRVLELCRIGLAEGWLVPREAGPSVRFGRVAKDMGGYAVDTVVMEDASGLGHTHTRGEINMCFALAGEPRFDGQAPGWVVFAPGSHHVPTVEGGTMLFIYFTPGGEVEWDREGVRGR